MNVHTRLQAKIESVENPSDAMIAYVTFRREHIGLLVNPDCYSIEESNAMWDRMNFLFMELPKADQERIRELANALREE